MTDLLHPSWHNDARMYDSPTARTLEAFMALRADASFVAVWGTQATRLSAAQESMMGEDGATAKALWNASLVALFRSLKQAPSRYIVEAYQSALEALSDEHRVAFVRWEVERDKSVAHAVGHSESHPIVVEWVDGGPRVAETLQSMIPLAPGPHAGRMICDIAAALFEEADRAIKEWRRRVNEELVTNVDRLGFERLPTATAQVFKPHGRRFGA